ncbi:MAG: ferrous iron transport protein B [Candidatus Wukongarchaeota archaeon]|nr:ferrous iron transport protein B [Candidatus Wukongarchaeota archaeon]
MRKDHNNQNKKKKGEMKRKRWRRRGKGKEKKDKKKISLKVFLAGQPNVGKSALFNRLTGLGVDISNYPGTTVEVMRGKTSFHREILEIVDLPGVYAFGATSEDERVAIKAILEEKPDVIVNVVDACTLDRDLFFTMQLLLLKIPVVIALNQVDRAEKLGLYVDSEKLSRSLGVSVVPIIATKGLGIDSLFRVVLREGKNGEERPIKLRLGYDIDKRINSLEKEVKGRVSNNIISDKLIALWLLASEDYALKEVIDQKTWKELNFLAKGYQDEIEKIHGEKAFFRLAKEIHAYGWVIADAVTMRFKEIRRGLKERLDELTTSFSVGIPLLIAIFLASFAFIVFVGGMLEELIVWMFEDNISPVVESFLNNFISPEGILHDIIMDGVILGIEAGMAIAVPYILTFYIILALLEDSGYLPRIAYLLDNLAHKVGLHGRAVIPALGGFGCSVPAIMGTRILETRRERIIAAYLIVLIPCSARSAVIFGAVGYYAGFLYALAVYLIDFLIVFLAGIILNRILPGTSTGFLLEIPPFRTPDALSVMKKTWFRMKDFVIIAFPILIAGSVLLAWLSSAGYLDVITDPLEPVTVGLLGLPSETSVPLIYGILRKEMALETLVILQGVSLSGMTAKQLFIFSTVITLWFPCIASLGVLSHELGKRVAVLIAISTMMTALAVGALLNFIL